ncbi:MAG: M56 family metallopeptidase [Isosphaeraceae bacterium]
MTWQAITAGSSAPAALLLTWLVQSSVLLAIGLILGRASRRWGPAVQSAVYRTTLVAVLLCPIASFAMAAMGFGGLMLRLPELAATEGTPPAAAGRVASIMPASVPLSAAAQIEPQAANPTDEIPGPARQRILAASMPSASVIPTTAGPPREIERPASTPAAAMPWIGLVARLGLALIGLWVVGSLTLLIRLAVGQSRMARLRLGAVPADLEAETLCKTLAHQMRLDPPSVLRSPFLSSPCLDGLRRPAILLPEEAEANLRETFIHELAHLSRRDGLWNLLRRLASALFWFQPLLWVLSRRIEESAEEVCDDFVVAFGADRTQYAGHLLELAGRTLPPLAPSGVGMISLPSMLGRRIRRILDSSRQLSTRAGRRAVAATLIAGLAGTILAGLVGVGTAARAVQGDQKDDEKAAAAANPKVVRGQVVAPDGKPVAGARVVDLEYLAPTTTIDTNNFRMGSGHWPWTRRELDRGVTDAYGRYQLSIRPCPPDASLDENARKNWNMPLVVAQAPGFGPAWWDGSRDLPADKPLRLVRDDVPIEGRVIDLEGRPVAGATVQVRRLVAPQDMPEFEKWLAAMRPKSGGNRPEYPGWSFLELTAGTPALWPPVHTDADGRFRLTGIGRDRIATLDVTGDAIAFQQIQVITRDLGATPIKGERASGTSLVDPDYHGARFTMIAQPGQAIEGTVRDARTKAPIAGVTVAVQTLAGTTTGVEGLVTAVTGADGGYRLAGLPKGDGHRLGLYPPLDQPYFINDSLRTPKAPGLGPVRLDIDLKPGIWISGRVTDARTGRPVQAAIHFFPFLANEHAEGYPNFQPGLSLFWTGNRHRTDAEGNYRVVGIPGRGIVAAHSFDGTYRMGSGVDRLSVQPGPRQDRAFGLPTYNAMNPLEYHAVAEVNPTDRAVEVHQDLILEPGRSLVVQLVDPDGKPVTEASAHGLHPLGNDGHDSGLDEKSRVEVTGLDPKVSRTVVFQHHGRNLGATLVIKPGESVDGVRTVSLRPCGTVTGRLVDGEGKPVAATIELGVNHGDNNGHGSITPGYKVGEDGRFRLNELIPGATHQVRAADPVRPGTRMTRERFGAFAMAERLVAEPGQVIDLGTFNVETGQRVKEPEKPAGKTVVRATEVNHNVAITSRIIDLEGRPIAGVKVRVTGITKPKSGDLSPWIEALRRGEPPWVAYRHLEEEKDETKVPKGFVETDKGGRFQLPGIPAECHVGVTVEGPTIAYMSLEVVTRKMDPFKANGFSNTHGPGVQTIHGAEFTYTASPGRVVEGTVVDAKTQKPMGDVGVWSYGFAGSTFGGIKSLKTRTDSAGRFRIEGMPKGRGNKLFIVPDDEQPYFMQELSVPDTAGLGPVAVEVVLHRGIFIEGKVTEKGTGKPVAGAFMHYFPFLDNTFAQQVPEFRRGGYTDGAGHQDRYKSKSDGSYRLVGLPGRAIVGAVDYSGKPYRRGAGSESIKGMNKNGHFPVWNNPVPPGRYFPTSMKEITPDAKTETAHLDIEMDPGMNVGLRVVDPQGKPVEGMTAIGRAERGRQDRRPLSASTFDVEGLGPGEDRMVVLQQAARKLGRVVHVKPGDDAKERVVVKLEPAATITGRVVDADNQPVPGALVGTQPQPGGDFSPRLPEIVSGKDGRFSFTNIPVGCQYGLFARSGASYVDTKFAVRRDINVRPGEMTDIGDLKFDRN